MITEEGMIQAGKQVGFKLTDDLKTRHLIIEGLNRKGGYCPCKVKKTIANLCICDEAVTTGVCMCGMFVKDLKEGEDM